MPSLTSLEFLVGEAFAGISRNRLMSVTATIVAAISLAVSAGFGVAALAVHRACEKLPQEFDIAVYIRKGIDHDRIGKIKQEIINTAGVGKVQFISDEQAWKDFKASLGADIRTEDVLYNPALNTFKVSMEKPEASEALVKKMRAAKEVDSVLWRKDEVEFFRRLSRVVGVVGGVTMVVLFCGSLFIIGNTIRLGIYARRREVAIMRLVGASPSFIRLPFILEGMILSGIGAALGAVLLRLAGSYLTSITGGLQTVTRMLDSGLTMFEITFALLLAGVILGAVSSLVSIRRYLREGSPETSR